MRRVSGSLKFNLRHHLKRGGVVVYPTESCFGLGSLPNNPHALRKILRLKKRPMNKGMIVVGGKVEQLQALTLFRQPETLWQLQTQWQQQPTSFLLPAHKNNALPLLRGVRRDTIALRLPCHTGLKNLCLDLNTALVSTSANRSHAKPCRTTREARRLFGQKALVISGKIGKYHSPSRIIDWQSGQVLR